MCALRHTARFSDASNIVENVREACWLKVHYLWRTWQGLGEPRNRAITDRADVTQFLGKNYVRAQVPQKRLVDCVNCAFVAQCPPHPLINFGTRQAGIVNWTMRDPWPRIRFLWKIALMRNTDHLVHQAKCGCDFRRSRQKRNDPDHFLLYAASWYEDRKRSPSIRTKEKERGERAKEFQVSRIAAGRVPYKTPTACEISRTTMVR